MKTNNALQKNGFHFGLNVIAAVLTVLAMAAYVVGASVFSYYDDLNVVVLLLAAMGAVAALLAATIAKRTGDTLLTALLGIVASVLLTACIMLIVEARVYSFAVLMLSDLERDNVDGYHALYSSMAAVGTLLASVGCIVASGFVSAKKKEL